MKHVQFRKIKTFSYFSEQIRHIRLKIVKSNYFHFVVDKTIFYIFARPDDPSSTARIAAL